MTSQTTPELSICNDKTLAVPRQADADGFYLHCAGGFRAALVRDDVWMVEPVFENGHPCRKGFLSKDRLFTFIQRYKLTPIAFHHFGWIDGKYTSTWSPLVPGRKNHMQGPSDLWSNVAGNLARQRSDTKLRAMAAPTREEIAKLLDDRTGEEWLAHSISLSLRSMDISVEQIVEFYHEQLVNLMATGGIDGRRSCSTQCNTLFAHVHSFYLHLGAAHDYLGALIAARIGENTDKTDSMSRLIDVLRSNHFGKDALLDRLKSSQLIRPTADNEKKMEWSGWLKEAFALRKKFVHKRPYGGRHAEMWGHVTAIGHDIGLYRYVRPVIVDNDLEKDVLDVVLYHYKQTTRLFQDMAEDSGRDISMLTLTDKEISSATWRKLRPGGSGSIES